ncbi:MAG: phage holin family protein [Candidatus Cloacimonetes bacterium]|nr:phage holin family protein [Candidatus Cloacimonadota bacterium]MBL7086284.1 phage holin family protein [Candidatus Cloacimonadota bacterium]
MNYIIQLLIYSVAVYIVSKVTNFIEIKDFKTAIFFSIVLGIVNTFIKPIFFILTFPITVLTFGFFLIFINGLMLMISSAFFKEIRVKGCFSAALASILISIIVYIFTHLIFVQIKF